MRRRAGGVWPGPAALLLTALAAAGCQRGAAVGGGAYVGSVMRASTAAAVGQNQRAAGGWLGGSLGAGGGYLVGAHLERAGDARAARDAARAAQLRPARVSDVFDARTADLNRDGFVSLDEVVAMKNAGLSDPQMLEWLALTRQQFRLNDVQRRYLIERGVSRHVVERMASLNLDQRPRPLRRAARG